MFCGVLAYSMSARAPRCRPLSLLAVYMEAGVRRAKVVAHRPPGGLWSVTRNKDQPETKGSRTCRDLG